MAVLQEIFLLLLAAVCLALAPRHGAFLAVGAGILSIMAVRGYYAMRGDARKDGWPVTLLRAGLVASAVLVVRRLKTGAWF